MMPMMTLLRDRAGSDPVGHGADHDQHDTRAGACHEHFVIREWP